MRRRALLLAVFLMAAAVTAAAQESVLSGSGGELRMIPKKSTGLSGSLGVSFSQADSFGLGGNRYGATLGGTVVPDRVWFFASAEQQNARMATAGVDAKVLANLGDRQNLSAIFGSADRSAPAPGDRGIPSSFLSMRYTGVLSENMFFNASVSRRTVTQSDIFAPK